MNTSFARALICAFTIAGAVFLSEAGWSQPISRTEVHPVQTVTLSTADFLLGKKDGKPVTIAGELRIPKPGTDRLPAVVFVHGADRKSTRLNSSHDQISYAVFCLKKKK